MKEWFNRTRAGLVLWKLAITRCITYMLVVGLGCYLTSTEKFNSETWAALGSFEKHRIYIGCFIAAAGVLVAFLDSTLSRLQTKPISENEKSNS